MYKVTPQRFCFRVKMALICLSFCKQDLFSKIIIQNAGKGTAKICKKIETVTEASSINYLFEILTKYELIRVIMLLCQQNSTDCSKQIYTSATIHAPVLLICLVCFKYKRHHLRRQSFCIFCFS